MRVISGSARGLKLKAPKGLNTRPTTDRIKESFFNIISPYVYGCRFLDLFSGSGSIGVEALSRGSEAVFFVDSDKHSIEVINSNILSSKLSHKATVLKGDALSVLESLGKKGEKFDIIFMDPPYNKGFIQPCLNIIQSYKLLSEDGFIVAEQAAEEEELKTEGLEVYRIKDYKTTKMTFLKYKDN
ncbi:MAG: 16S rRNA (guanine(966)-N(2))-methyltransferase RsmD [Firmicutes bacterium]|nr:16S rRNA (guanine(966)-N(2))-methyltransferase RsmD [Bacillota bacterium]